MSHPEHSRESLPLFQQDSCGNTQAVVATQQREDCGRGHASPAPLPPAGINSAHARKSDGPNSHKAAQGVTNLGRTRDEILRILKHYGPQADEQIIYAFRKWGMNAASTCELCRASDSGIRSRRSELVAMGFVHEVGTGKTKSGRPCAIWALKERKA